MNTIILVIRWIARLAGTSLFVLLAMIMIAERFGFFRAGLQASLTGICIILALCGLLLAWRWEMKGGMLTTLSMIALYGIHFMRSGGRLPRGWVFPSLLMLGFLYMLCGVFSSKGRPHQPTSEADAKSPTL